MSQEKQNIRSFEDLKVWKCARQLQRKVAKLVKTFPKHEQYRLTDQMIRSSRSVPRNIAEGYGRYHYQENIQFCRHSRGSLCELLNDFITAFEENYINQNQLNGYRKHVTKYHKLINGYIAYLKKAKKTYRVEEEKVIYNTAQITNSWLKKAG